MADLPSHPDTNNHADREPGRGPTTTTPRWATVVGIIIAVVLVVLLAGLHLTGVIGPGAH